MRAKGLKEQRRRLSFFTVNIGQYLLFTIILTDSNYLHTIVQTSKLAAWQIKANNYRVQLDC